MVAEGIGMRGPPWRCVRATVRHSRGVTAVFSRGLAPVGDAVGAACPSDPTHALDQEGTADAARIWRCTVVALSAVGGSSCGTRRGECYHGGGVDMPRGRTYLVSRRPGHLLTLFFGRDAHCGVHVLCCCRRALFDCLCLDAAWPYVSMPLVTERRSGPRGR